MKMGGAASFENVQKPATAIQDHRYDSYGSLYVTLCFVLLISLF